MIVGLVYFLLSYSILMLARVDLVNIFRGNRKKLGVTSELSMVVFGRDVFDGGGICEGEFLDYFS